MQVTLLAAVSKDNFITDKFESTAWIPKEDAEHLSSYLKKCDALVMGRNTFHAERYRFATNSKAKRFVLSTTKPNKQDEQLATFYNMSLSSLINELKKTGHKHVAIVGGTKLCTEAVKESLANDVVLTRVPIMLHEGKHLFSLAKVMDDFEHYSLFAKSKLSNHATIEHYTIQS